MWIFITTFILPIIIHQGQTSLANDGQGLVSLFWPFNYLYFEASKKSHNISFFLSFFSEKSFSLFSVVSFPNRECTTSSDTSDTIVNGVCQRDDECISNGGTPSGNCASGFGVCCFYK